MYFMFQKLGLFSKYVFLIERPTTVGWGASHFLQNNPQKVSIIKSCVYILLDSVYSIIYFDNIYVKVNDGVGV